MIKANNITIYETLAEIADPGHSCLVVWDVQNGLVDRIFNKEEFLTNLKGLIETLRRKVLQQNLWTVFGSGKLPSV